MLKFELNMYYLFGLLNLYIFAVHVSDGAQIIEILVLIYFSRR